MDLRGLKKFVKKLGCSFSITQFKVGDEVRVPSAIEHGADCAETRTIGTGYGSRGGRSRIWVEITATSFSTPLTIGQQRPQQYTASSSTASTLSSSDTVKRSLATATRDSPKKRVRLQDPWHDLADIAVRMFKGDVVDLPPEETKDTEMDSNRKLLYELAWGHLKDTKSAKEQQYAGLHFRDAFVALSGVFNMYSPVTRKVMSSADSLEAKRLCLIPELENKDEELTKLLDSLKTSKTRRLTVVLEDV
ncbi:hypothetical protein BGX21_006019 [Mortierella sp. AD011]|nr:hypothetical protein BGX20_004355 [Mortierella sp. AD010]KAF9369304.1 hypothetical protein BGX21_006019 [Mortierella sp. AD011]